MNNQSKVSVYLECRDFPTDILRKQQCFSLIENLDNSLHTSESMRLFRLWCLYASAPSLGRSPIYTIRCELNFILCVQGPSRTFNQR